MFQLQMYIDKMIVKRGNKNVFVSSNLIFLLRKDKIEHLAFNFLSVMSTMCTKHVALSLMLLV